MPRRHTQQSVAAKSKVADEVKSRLDKLAADGVTSKDRTAVRRYLRRHGGLVSLLPAVCQEVRREFGPAAELSLEVYRDPETNDKYLTLAVRLPRYGPDMMDRIERVSQSFESRITPSSGYLLVTTDFRPARETNGL